MKFAKLVECVGHAFRRPTIGTVVAFILKAEFRSAVEFGFLSFSGHIMAVLALSQRFSSQSKLTKVCRERIR